MEPKERAIRQRLKDDFEHYAAKCLSIRTKSGLVVHLKLNVAQKHIHACVEAQRAETGRVRAIILKGRQQGCCLSPDTLVTKANLTTCRIDDLLVGDTLLSLDEEFPGKDPSGKNSTRKMRTAKVEAKVEFKSML